MFFSLIKKEKREKLLEKQKEELFNLYEKFHNSKSLNENIFILNELEGFKNKYDSWSRKKKNKNKIIYNNAINFYHFLKTKITLSFHEKIK